MKIAVGTIIQERMIRENTKDTFDAVYKKYSIYITSDHGHGKPEYDHLTRYDITVRGEDGGYLVDTYEDYHTMKDAIRDALQGAMLIK